MTIDVRYSEAVYRRLYNMFSKKVALASALLFLMVVTFGGVPQSAQAFIWGGQFSSVIPCFGNSIWVQTGPPNGGEFIWVSGVTETYQNGPPQHAGQYGLGLAAPPSFCLISLYPVLVVSGFMMTMLGTSQ